MTSIEKAFKDRSPGPYSLGLKVKVVAREEPITYMKDGVSKPLLTCAVSDGTDVIKMLCYSSEKFQLLKDGAYVMLREIITKIENTERIIVVTSKTKVITAFKNVEVTQDLIEAAKQILNPPPAEVISITSALSSPLKKKVSVAGKIIQEEEPRTVEKNKEKVQIKNIVIEDSTGHSKVTLWRETSEQDVRPGDHVTITDVIVNSYNSVISLSTTFRSKIKKCDAPLEQVDLTVDGMCVTGEEVELITENNETICVQRDMLERLCCTGENKIEDFCPNEPLYLKITRCGGKVLKIEKS